MKTLLFAVLATVAGGAASAQDFYIGGALDYAYPHSGDTQTLGSFVAGVGLGQGAFGYGAEVEVGTHLAGDADYGTQRLRLWGTYDLGFITARAAAGVTEHDFDGVTSEGYNLGIGVQNDVSDHVTLRGEFIRDFMGEESISDVTNTRIGAVYRF